MKEYVLLWKMFKMMNVFKPCVQIGSRHFLVTREEYEVVSFEEWKNRMSSKLNIESTNVPQKKTLNILENEIEDYSMDICNDLENMCVDSSNFEDIENEQSGKSSFSSSVTSHSTTSSIYTSLVPLKPVEKLLTETLFTETKVHVVWQDGTVEHNILSTSLYPLSDLDSHELFSQFFPGDYVTDNRESRPYEYGVVKRVDHSGRTALITWMKAYQVGGDPHPEILSEEEVSVYDVKYHSYFQFRPGSCVIGVDNSKDTNPGFSAGQVVDAHPTGKVEVSWGNGKTSLYYPQELYKIGEYDFYGIWISDKCSSGTESEKPAVGNENEPENRGDRTGMARLNEVFIRNPILLSCNVMRRFYELYKHCKYYLAQSSQPVGLQQIVFTKSAFSMLESVPDQHIYKLSTFQPVAPSAFFKIVRNEMNILRSSLPEGIIVRSFEDRIDLYSVLIKGPKQTPYEDSLFFFDFQFPADYPKVPPLCHYISYCLDRINPNLYEEGEVCISLLGTFPGEGSEMWSPETSNLMQVIISIQGLILVAEPYYNEPVYEKQRGTEQGRENSRMYNEMVVLKLVQAMTNLIMNPPEIFKQEIVEHFQTNTSKFVQRLEKWLAVSESWNSYHPFSPAFKEAHSDNIFAQDIPLPEFPLIPTSKGFCLTLRKSLSDFKEVVSSILPSIANR